MIDRATVAQILDRAEIVDVVSDFVSLQRRGQNLIGLCPFHNDRRPSFYVSPSKNICKCFACGEGGSPLNFIMKIENLSYLEALRYLAKKYGIEIVEQELSPEERARQSERERMLHANAFVRDAYVSELHNSGDGRRIGLSYFEERHFTAETIKTFELGYAPESPSFLAAKAAEAGISLETLEALGLVLLSEDGTHRDRFRERVIFPIHSMSGNVVGFGGRIMRHSERLAKYINSPESTLYNKRNELYGIYFARQHIAREDVCYVVEGYTDVLSFYQAGIRNTVASSGTALTKEQGQLIKRLTHKVVLIFDSDAAGIKAAFRGIDILLAQGFAVRVVLLPEGHDPDSFAKAHTSQQVVEYIERHADDFIRFKTTLLTKNLGTGPQAKVETLHSIASSIAVIEDPMVRDVYVRDTAELLSVTMETLYGKVESLRREQQQMQRREAQREEQRQAGIEASREQEKQVEQRAVPHAVPPSAPVPPKVDRLEENIAKYLVRIGGRKLLLQDEQTGSSSEVSVAELISRELDDVMGGQKGAAGVGQISDTLQAILRECIDHAGDPTFDSQKLLTAHPDIAIREVANRVAGDPYILSRLHERFEVEQEDDEALIKSILTDILTLKYGFVQRGIDRQLALIKEMSSDVGEPPRYSARERETAMTQLQHLNNLKRRMAELLGDRVAHTISRRT